jgi:hypothetical protein
MAMWRAKDRRILARFWSRTGDVESCFYEVTGLKDPPPMQECLRMGTAGFLLVCVRNTRAG